MTTDYYVYAYLREDLSPYYIGMGRRHRAYASHKRGAFDFRPTNKTRIVMLKTGMTRDEALAEEQKVIAQYKLKADGGVLINLTSGGECPVFSLETRQKMSSIHMGKSKNPASIQKMVERRKADGSFIPTVETRMKLREARLGKLTGANNPVAKKINAYDRSGNLLGQFNTAREAAIALNLGECWKHIPAVCRGRRPHTKGFVFKYSEE